MQITATLSGSTATIATSQCGISTALTVTDATNLATDLAPFTVGDAPSVDASTFTMRGTPPVTPYAHHWDHTQYNWAPPGDEWKDVRVSTSAGPPRDKSFRAHARGYWLDATNNGVRITDPATNGKLTIPRDQIAAVIAGLNA